MSEEMDVRERLGHWMTSSGGCSAALDDDKDPRHLLFLVAQELARVDLENEALMSRLDCHAGFCSHHVPCNGPVARHRDRAEEVMRRNDDHSLAEP